MKTFTKTSLIALVIATAMPAGAALAQYAGPSSIPTMTVKQLKEEGRDDQNVILRGHIISHNGDEHYTFADDTGTLPVEIDRRRLPQGQSFDDKTLVELVGEYDKDLMSSEFDVDEVRILP